MAKKSAPRKPKSTDADVETYVGQMVGDVDVVQLDHHGSTTAFWHSQMPMPHPMRNPPMTAPMMMRVFMLFFPPTVPFKLVPRDTRNRRSEFFLCPAVHS